MRVLLYLLAVPAVTAAVTVGADIPLASPQAVTALHQYQQQSQSLGTGTETTTLTGGEQLPTDPEELWAYLNNAPADHAATDEEIEAFILDYQSRREQARQQIAPYTGPAEQTLVQLEGLRLEARALFGLGD